MRNATATVQHMDDKRLTPVIPALVKLMIKLLHKIPERITNYASMLESSWLIGNIKLQLKTNTLETCPIAIIMVSMKSECKLFCQFHVYWHTR
jgi:hypothetical protein